MYKPKNLLAVIWPFIALSLHAEIMQGMNLAKGGYNTAYPTYNESSIIKRWFNGGQASQAFTGIAIEKKGDEMSTKKLSLEDLIKCNQLEQIVIIGGLYDKYKEHICNYIQTEFSPEELKSLKTKLITQLMFIENNTLDFINDMNQKPKLHFNKYNGLFPRWENCNELLNHYIDENFDVKLVFEEDGIKIFTLQPFAGIPPQYLDAIDKIMKNYNVWFVDTLKIHTLLRFKCANSPNSVKLIQTAIHKKMDEFEQNHGYHVKDVLKRMLNITYAKSEYKKKGK